MIEIVVFTIAIILLFDFINGFHDTANQVSPAISTRSLKPNHAIILAAFMNLLGPFILGLSVADTIGSIANYDALKTLPPEHILMILTAGILSACSWNLITWWKGIPSSSSHALVGGIVGAVITGVGADGIKLSAVIKTLQGLIFSPVFAFAVTFLSIILFFWVSFRIFRNRQGINMYYRYSQIFFVVFTAIGHGGNDATKSMGIIGLVLLVSGYTASFHIPWEVVVACSFSMALGTALGGIKIIRTMAKRVTKMDAVMGFGAEVANTLTLNLGTVTGFPMSTTHVITGSILGAGSSKGLKCVRWDMGRNILFAWILTIPVTAFIAAFIVICMRSYIF